MSTWRKSNLAALSAIVLFAAIQLAIPISRMAANREIPPRFSWHMFSVPVPAPAFVIETADGEIPVNLEDYVARARSDIDLEALLPPHLCRVHRTAKTVIWDEGRFEC